MRRSSKVFIAMLIGIITNDAQSVVPAPVLFKDAVADSAKIVVAVVTKRRPVNFTFGGEEHTCGFAYTAAVERAYKGDASSVEFFDPNTTLPLLPGNRLLALLFKYDPSEAERLVGELEFEDSDLAGRRFLCQLRSSSLAVRESPRTLFRFTDDDVKGAVVVPEGAPILPAEVVSRYEDGLLLVEWKDLERELEEALGAEVPR